MEESGFHLHNSVLPKGLDSGVTLLLTLLPTFYLPLDLPSGRSSTWVMLGGSQREQLLFITVSYSHLHMWKKNQQSSIGMTCASGSTMEFRWFDLAILINVPQVILISPCFLSPAAHPSSKKDNSNLSFFRRKSAIKWECAVFILRKSLEFNSNVWFARKDITVSLQINTWICFETLDNFIPGYQKQPQCPKSSVNRLLNGGFI